MLRETVRCKLNMEMSLDAEIVRIALDLKPDQASLVPESREEITTEGGLDVLRNASRFAEVVRKLGAAGITVSAFVDPDPRQIRAALEAGCQAIEIHTGAYANAVRPDDGSNPDGNAVEQMLDTVAEGLEAVAAVVGARAGIRVRRVFRGGLLRHMVVVISTVIGIFQACSVESDCAIDDDDVVTFEDPAVPAFYSVALYVKQVADVMAFADDVQ